MTINLRYVFFIAAIAWRAQGADAVMNAGPAWTRIEYKGWTNAYRLQTTNFIVIVVADIGGRIMEYGPPGRNILWQDAKCFGKTFENQGHFLPGGSQFDLMDENGGGFSDRDSTLWVGKYKAVIRSPTHLTAVSAMATNFGLQITRDFEVDPATGRLSVIQTVSNCGKDRKKISVWDRTWTMAPCLLALPVEANKDSPESWRFVAPDGKGGQQFLPATHDPAAAKQFQRAEGILTVKPSGKLCMIAVKNSKGWFAYARDRLLHIKRYEINAGRYPLYNCPACVWLSGQDFKGAGPMAEMELMSRIFELEPGQTCIFREDWYLQVLADPVETPVQLRNKMKEMEHESNPDDQVMKIITLGVKRNMFKNVCHSHENGNPDSLAGARAGRKLWTGFPLTRE